MGSFMVCKKVHYYCKDLFSLLLLYFWDIISCSPRGFMEYKISQNKQKKRNQNLKVGKKTSNGLGMTSYSCWDKTNSPSCEKKTQVGTRGICTYFWVVGIFEWIQNILRGVKFLRKQKFINQLPFTCFSPCFTQQKAHSTVLEKNYSHFCGIKNWNWFILQWK